MHLERATWTEVADLETGLAVLPVGSTEQHGPHAAVSTDAVAARAVAETGIERFDGDVLCAPTIAVGVSEEHRHFPGTMWVSADSFRRYVRDCVGSLAAHGFDRVVVVNGHGGNVGPLGEVTATITRHDDAYAVPFTWFDAIGDHADEMGHGGPLETSLLLATAPELVREDRLEAAREGAADRWGEWVSGTNLAADTVEFAENGVVGDPSEADPARGRALLELAGIALADLLEAVGSRDLDGDGEEQVRSGED